MSKLAAGAGNVYRGPFPHLSQFRNFGNQHARVRLSRPRVSPERQKNFFFHLFLHPEPEPEPNTGSISDCAALLAQIKSSSPGSFPVIPSLCVQLPAPAAPCSLYLRSLASPLHSSLPHRPTLPWIIHQREGSMRYVQCFYPFFRSAVEPDCVK